VYDMKLGHGSRALCCATSVSRIPAGVEVHTFRATDSSLPALSDGAWPRLLKAGMARHPAAASAHAPHGTATTEQGRAAGARPGSSGGADGDAKAAPAGAAPAHGAAAFLLAEPGFLDVSFLISWRQSLRGAIQNYLQQHTARTAMSSRTRSARCSAAQDMFINNQH
jgi:hypothetical protein